jgi:hypothetical protein
MSKLKIITPQSTLIETVAAQLACTFYEVGRGQGLTSKYKTAKAFARANLNKFIPKAVEILLQMLKPDSNCTPEMREEIYEALMERHNDPELNKVMPNIDVKKLIEAIDQIEKRKVVTINTKSEPKTILHKATRH